MRINNAPIVDPKDIVLLYMSKGYSTELLRKCNAQEFKYIDGYGEGYFLLTNVLYTSGQTITFTVPGTSVTETLYVTECIDIQAPTFTATKLRIIRTAEEKFKYHSLTVSRNYNVINRKTQIANTAAIVSPDATPKTLQQVFNSILGLTCTYTPPTIIGYDIFIEGMSVLDAMDKLCAAFGLLWRVQGNSVYVYSAVSAVDIPINQVNDIRDQQITTPIQSFTVVYPALNCCLQAPITFQESTIADTIEGRILRVYMPYFPAIFTTEDGLQNEAGLIFVRDHLFELFYYINQIEGNYIAHEYYRDFDLNEQPAWFSIIYADYGVGSRTIVSCKDYPYLTQPVPAIEDRQANNWIGYIYQTYKGADTPGFWVVPAFGIDGLAPLTNRYVINLYKWDYGAAGALVRVEWDCYNYRWIPIQQQYICPPNETPPPMDPPPIPEEYPPIDYEG
jgi:hypothetical protein